MGDIRCEPIIFKELYSRKCCKSGNLTLSALQWNNFHAILIVDGSCLHTPSLARCHQSITEILLMICQRKKESWNSSAFRVTICWISFSINASTQELSSAIAWMILDVEVTTRAEALRSHPSAISAFHLCMCTTIWLLHGRFPIHAVYPGNR